MAFLLFLCGGKPFFQNWAMVALMVILLFKAVFYFVIERILAGVDVMNRDTSSSVRKVSRIKRLNLIGAIVSYALLIPLVVFLSLQFHLDTLGIIVVSVAALILAAVAVKVATGARLVLDGLPGSKYLCDRGTRNRLKTLF